MSKMQAPKAKKITHETKIHDAVLKDDYFWLRDKKNPEVIKYLEDENKCTESYMADTKDLQKKLFNEIRGRIKETDQSPYTKKDDYYYYSRTEEGKEYRTYCRKKGSTEAAEEILLDVNKLAEGHDYYSLGVYDVSPDHKLLAYSVDTNGSEKFNLYIKNLETGELLEDVLENTLYSFNWVNDNKTFYYTTQNEQRRPDKVWRHSLGTKQENDELILEESDEKFFVGLSKTRSEQYIFIDIESKVTSEAHYLNANNPEAKPILVAERKQDVEYEVYHHEDDFYIVTNENALNYKLVKTPISKPGRENWRDVIPHKQELMLEGISLFKDFMIVWELSDALSKAHVMGISDKKIDYYLEFPEEIYDVGGYANPDYETETFRVSYSSMRRNNTVYEFNYKTGERTVVKEYEVLGGYEPEDYIVERIEAPARDGEMVPVSLVYKKGLDKNGESPCLLYGYGSYGSFQEPWFNSKIISFLDRGFVYAIAHIRGSRAKGRHWYEDGKYLNKKNTFYDFIDSAKHLVKEGYTSHEKLAVMGGSAGGLLVGASINIDPSFASVAVADVPFVDVINTMLDETIPLTVIEYEEWGNPNEKKYFDYMMSYSPYDNVEKKEYPKMLVTGGLNDTRVQYWEPAKWVAKLRENKTGDNTLLLKTEMGKGHMGATGRYDYIKEVVFKYAFILKELGIKI